jgi:ferric-dicitrate binding protein FerR (iron transport regulator)
MQQLDDYIILLNKAFTGEISPAESAQLTQWMQQSPENQKIATDMQAMWEATGASTRSFHPDLDADFSSLQKRIAAQTQPTLKVAFRASRLLRVAAAMALLLGAYGVWRVYNSGGAAMQVETVADAGFRKIQLPDGTSVWLRKNSTLTFQKQFNGVSRRVQLNGEAYFEVLHDAARPFSVALPDGSLVEDLGTEFDVRAFPSDAEASVLVKSGSVRFSPGGSKNGVELTPGMKGIFDKSAHKMTIDESRSFGDLAWQSGGLEFISTPLSTVVSDLERFYKVRIDLRNESLRSCTYTAPLTNQSIDKVLESLAISYHFQVKKTGESTYALLGGNCK